MRLVLWGFLAPACELFGKRAVGAVAVIAQAEVLVDLEQALLQSGMAGPCRGCRRLRARAEETLAGSKHTTVDARCAQAGEVLPKSRIAGAGEGVEDVGQHRVGACVADEGHGLAAALGVEGEVVFPEGMTQPAQKVREGVEFAAFAPAPELMPVGDELCQRSESPLWMIGGTLSAEDPPRARDVEPLVLRAPRPPCIPELADIIPGFCGWG